MPETAFPDAIYFSASQFGKLTSCEEQWVRMKSSDAKRTASGEPAALGTLLHTLQGAWWSGRNWRRDWVHVLVDEVGTEAGYAYDLVEGVIVKVPGYEAPKHFLRALPIMEAWEEVHGVHPSEDQNTEAIDALDFRETTTGLTGASLVALELPFDLAIPGVPNARVRGFIDGIVSIPHEDGIPVHGDHKALEFKSMGRWGKDGRVAWDPQVNLYLWAARQLFNVSSMVFEAISTYAYKDGGPERRFRRIEVAYDERAVARTLEDMKRAARRGKALLKNPGLAVRNAGEACTYCDYFKECRTPWDL